jgi:hypothetical protein
MCLLFCNIVRVSIKVDDKKKTVNMCTFLKYQINYPPRGANLLLLLASLSIPGILAIACLPSAVDVVLKTFWRFPLKTWVVGINIVLLVSLLMLFLLLAGLYYFWHPCYCLSPFWRLWCSYSLLLLLNVLVVSSCYHCWCNCWMLLSPLLSILAVLLLLVFF